MGLGLCHRTNEKKKGSTTTKYPKTGFRTGIYAIFVRIACTGRFVYPQIRPTSQYYNDTVVYCRSYCTDDDININKSIENAIRRFQTIIF